MQGHVVVAAAIALATPSLASPADAAPNAANPRLPGYTAVARDAAAHAQCDVVKALGAMTRDVDPAYYRTAFSRDPAVEACLTGRDPRAAIAAPFGPGPTPPLSAGRVMGEALVGIGGGVGVGVGVH